MNSIAKHFLHMLAGLADRESQPIYLVGGTVRDCLLGKTPADYDFTSIDAPALAKAFAKEAKLPLVSLDQSPGRETFRVVAGTNLYFDFSRLQGRTLDEDLNRRDFTFNAMAILLKDFLAGGNAIIDPHHGAGDLRNRVVRVLPGNIFSDDPLRMVRAFRFASTLNFAIEPGTLAKITGCKSQLARVAFERVNYELLLFLGAKDIFRLLVLMEKTGLLHHIFPEISVMTSQPEGMTAWNQTLNAIQIMGTLEGFQGTLHEMVKSIAGKERSLLVMAALLHRLPDTIPALRRLRASNAEVSFIDKTIKGQQTALAGFEAFIQDKGSSTYRFVKQCGDELIPALVLALSSYCARNNLRAAPSNPFAEAVLKVYDFYVNRYLPAQKLPAFLNGDDLINQFNMPPSPQFRSILSQIEECRVLGIIKTREEAQTLAKNLIDNK